MSTKNTTPGSANQIDEVYFAVNMHVDGDNVIQSAITNLVVTASSYRLQDSTLVKMNSVAKGLHYQRYLIPTSLVFNTALMAQSDWTREELCEHGEQPDAVAKELSQFIKVTMEALSPTSSKQPKAVMMGYGIEQDVGFLTNLFARANIEMPFSKTLDLRTLHAIKANISLRAAKRKNLPLKIANANYESSSLIDNSRELAILGYNLLEWVPDPF